MSALDLPALGPNKLQQALDDYHHLEDERDHLQNELKVQLDLVTKLLAENDAHRQRISDQEAFYGQEIQTLNVRNRRLERLTTALMTRFKTIKECFEAAEVEAAMESVGPDEAKAPAITKAAIAAAVEMTPTSQGQAQAPKAKRKPRPLPPETPSEDELALQALGLNDPTRRQEIESILPLNLYPS